MHPFNGHKMCVDVCIAAYCLLAVNQVKKPGDFCKRE